MNAFTRHGCQWAQHELLLPGERREDESKLRAHLASCDACAAVASDLERFEEVGHAYAASLSPSADARERIFAALGDTVGVQRTVGEPRMRWPIKLALPLAVVAAAVLLLFALPVARSELVAHIEAGSVGYEVERPTPELAEILAPDCWLQTNDVGHARVSFGPARWALRPKSRASWHASGKDGATIALSAGDVVAELDPNAGMHLGVTTTRANVFVKGTIFEVSSDTTSTVVSVARGLVEVQPRKGGSVLVEAGERLIITDAGQRTTRLNPAEVQAMRHALSAAEEGVAPLPTREPSPEVAAQDTSTASAPPRRARRAPSHHDEAPLDALATMAKRGQCSALAGGIEARKLAAHEKAQALVMLADCHLAQSDKDRALKIYEMVARNFAQTTSGMNATYEAGRLRLERGERAAARTAFQTYLRQQPRGPLASEASFRVCAIDVDQHELGRALACLRKHQLQYAHDERAGDAIFLEATILREQSDCAHAVDAYARYLQRGGDHVEQARQWRAWCEKQLSGQK